MFRRFFGARRNTAEAKPPAPDDDLITAFDAFGREVKVRRSEWRDKVLAPNLEAHRDDPDRLYDLIIGGVNDGFSEDLAEAAAHLVAIDPDAERSHAAQGIVLTRLGRLDEAEASLRAGMARAGETAALLSNLAKVQADQGHEELAEDTLWRAIRADPNFDTGLMWWLALRRAHGGEAGYREGLETVARLPGSWRAQLWRARAALDDGDVELARAIYTRLLYAERYDAEALTMISGDLGAHGLAGLIPDLVGKAYDPDQHDPRTGLNLLEAYRELGRHADGEALLQRLYARQIAPLKPRLDAFSQDFQKLAAEQAPATPVEPTALDIATVALDRPIWAYGLMQPGWLLADKPADARAVAVFALAKTALGETAERQREDDIGRMTRAVALYLAEAAHQWTPLAGHTYVSVVRGGGPVVFGGEPDPETICDTLPAAVAFLVTGAIEPVDESWKLTVRLWDRTRRRDVARREVVTAPGDLGEAALQLEAFLLEGLGTARGAPFDALYQRPSAQAMGPYLAALGQAFTLTLVANGVTPKAALWGERGMLELPLQMSLQWPAAEHLLALYVSGLGKARDYGSTIVEEFRARTLQRLGDSGVGGRLRPLAWKVFGMRGELEAYRAALPADAEVAYQSWLDRITNSGS